MHAPDFLVAGLPGGTEFHLLALGRTHARAGQVTSALDTLSPLARSLADLGDTAPLVIATLVECRLARGEVAQARALTDEHRAVAAPAPGRLGGIANQTLGDVLARARRRRDRHPALRSRRRARWATTTTPRTCPGAAALALALVRTGDDRQGPHPGRPPGRRRPRRRVAVRRGARPAQPGRRRRLDRADRGAALGPRAARGAAGRPAARPDRHRPRRPAACSPARPTPTARSGSRRRPGCCVGRGVRWRSARSCGRCGAASAACSSGSAHTARRGRGRRHPDPDPSAASAVLAARRPDATARSPTVLGVTVKAVEWHLSHVYRKLGIRSRTRAGRTRSASSTLERSYDRARVSQSRIAAHRSSRCRARPARARPRRDAAGAAVRPDVRDRVRHRRRRAGPPPRRRPRAARGSSASASRRSRCRGPGSTSRGSPRRTTPTTGSTGSPRWCRWSACSCWRSACHEMFASLESGRARRQRRDGRWATSIMRVPMIAQWVRAARQDPERREVCKIFIITLTGLADRLDRASLFARPERRRDVRLRRPCSILVELVGPFVAEHVRGGTPVARPPHRRALRPDGDHRPRRGPARHHRGARRARSTCTGWTIDVALLGARRRRR